MLKILLLVATLFSGAIYGQLGLDSLTINALKCYVHADGNISEIKDANLKKMLNYTTQLQVAARDSASQLLTAAQFYHQSGRDFQPGPISNNPNARSLYNKVWKMNRTMVDSFLLGYFQNNIPAEILNWPAHGSTTSGESFYLAPFVDGNGNGYYDPTNGVDYPCINGDQAIFFVFNDDTTHTKTNTPSLGIEVLGMAYAYKQGSFLDSVLFVDYTIRIKKQELTELRVGLWNDFDVGMWLDDMVGCFVDQNTTVAYNSDIEDEGPAGFGMHPPAAGCVIRSGLKADFGDNLDNNKDGCVDGLRNILGNCIPEDSAQNMIEYWKLTSHIYPWVDASVSIPPLPPPALNVYYTIQGMWPWGDSLYTETPSGFMNAANGDGYVPNGNGNPTSFAYPGNTFDTSGSFVPTFPSNWFQGNQGGDIRSVAGLGYATLAQIGAEFQISVAHYFARDTNSLNSFDAVHAMAVKINAFVDSVPNCSGSRLIGTPEAEAVKTIGLYPNPAQVWVMVSAPNVSTKEGAVLGLDGRIIATFRLDDAGKSTIHLGQLPAGLYIVRIGGMAEKLMVK